jgi:hypothetical protein
MEKAVKIVEPAGARSGGSWFKNAVGILLLLVLAAGAAYGAGWYGPTQKLRELEQVLDAERARSQFLERRGQELEARLSLHSAIVEITQLNFGLAQGHIARAKEFLSASTDASLRAVGDTLGQLKLDPVQGQQAIDTLLKLSASFDTARPPMEPSAAPPPAAPALPAPATN